MLINFRFINQNVRRWKCFYSPKADTHLKQFISVTHVQLIALGAHKGQGCNQRDWGGWSSPLARSKLRKKIKSLILADFVHTTPSKYNCKAIIPSQLSNFAIFSPWRNYFCKNIR